MGGVFLFLVAPQNAFAWGDVGHQTVAYIAEDNLTPAARARIEDILGIDWDLARVATWADDVRSTSRPETAPWHFIDIGARGSFTESDEPKFCLQHNCVVDQVTSDSALLGSSSAPGGKRFEALKFLVHFVGDLHQPLHCADDKDRGGNYKWVRVPTNGHIETIKLHSYWDRLLEVNTSETPRQLATALGQTITSQLRTESSKGTAADWAWESYVIARDVVYRDFDPGATSVDGVPLPSSYKGPKMRNLVNEQLKKAGLRLALLLNRALGH